MNAAIPIVVSALPNRIKVLGVVADRCEGRICSALLEPNQMKDNLVFQKYERARNIRSSGPVVRVNKGYFFFNRILVENISCDRVDLYVDPDENTVLIKPGQDFKLTFTSYGRATFSAAPFIHELQIADGFYSAQSHDDGMVFSYRD